VIGFSSELVRRIRELPGVTSATAIWPLPAIGAEPLVDFGIGGRPIPKGDWPRARPRIVMPQYFRTVEIPIKHGRDFDARDTRDATPVVIINETLARTFFPNENPIGRRIKPGLDDHGDVREREIIGVVGDVKADRFATEQAAEVYVPFPQCVSLELSLLIRSNGEESAALLERVRDVAAFLDKEVPFFDAGTLEEHLEMVLAQPRLNSTLLAAFALVAIVLTAIGVYGVMAYSVTQRRHEIGIRLALGAQRSAISQLVLREGTRLILYSVCAGSVVSVFALSHLGHFVQQPLGNSFRTTAFVAGLVGLVALLACWLPARRAAPQDPLAAIAQR
jgi:putative ABC transport system permease protein